MIILVLFVAILVHNSCCVPNNVQTRETARSEKVRVREELESLRSNVTALWNEIKLLRKLQSQEIQSDADEISERFNLRQDRGQGPATTSVFGSRIRVQFDGTLLPAVTSSYWLFRGNDIKTWSRLTKSDQLLLWHKGTTLLIHTIQADGNYIQLKLGDPLQDPDATPLINVSNGHWVAMEMEDKYSYCLLTIAISPGSESNQLEHGTADELQREFPTFSDIIIRFIRQTGVKETTTQDTVTE